MIKRENNAIISYITALLLYINTPDADKTIVKPFLNKPGFGETKYPQCLLGYNMVIDKSICQNKADDANSKENNRYILKWSVRGHFRNQVIGEGRKDTKLIWIRPFLKGKEKDNITINARPISYTVK